MTAPSAAWREGIARCHAEAAGALRLYLIAPADALGLTLAAATGDPDASNLMRAVASALAQVVRAPRKKPSLCICCPRAVRKADAFLIGVAMPHNDRATTAIGFAVCERCAAAPGDLHERAVSGLRRIWPELRPVTVTHPEGGTA